MILNNNYKTLLYMLETSFMTMNCNISKKEGTLQLILPTKMNTCMQNNEIEI